MSNHIVKLDAGHDVSIGECESCGDGIVILEIEMVKCIDLKMTERLEECKR